MTLNLDELEIIPIKDVPPGKRSKIDWDALLKRIPDGMAFVANKKTLNPDTVRARIKRFHKKRLYMDYSVRQNKDKVFILHNSEGSP